MRQVENTIVSIEQGKLSGCTKQDINGRPFQCFYGIPYAEPPIGELRFKSPEPALPWNDDILDCTKVKSFSKRRFYPGNFYGSEDDCLYLNIYTPQISSDPTNEKYPVMFWIPGYPFIYEMGSLEFYGPEFLVAKKVVLITINYRHGFLGFLKLNDPLLNVTGNAGLKDQVEALRWVKKNIEAFGGDSNKITIFGQGFGAAYVHLHMLSSMSRKLFHRAIMQSGSALCPWCFGGLRLDYDLVKALACEADNDEGVLDFLQDQSVDSILTNQSRLINCQEELMAGELNAITPVVEVPNDNAFISEQPEELIATNKAARIPILIGYNSHEGLLPFTFSAKTRLTPDFNDNRQLIPRDLQDTLETDELSFEVGNKIKEFYYDKETPSFDNLDRFIQFYTDEMFGYKILSTARAHAQSKNQVYTYIWSLDTILNAIRDNIRYKYKGVHHGDELGYL
ncbi:esterase E4-like, partial [Chrysoperla carnea]|uniref:esterase E4-like n=1 Tax=Chrysoperla carnea TaxID=189513 RepID=UPI001D079DCE